MKIKKYNNYVQKAHYDFKYYKQFSFVQQPATIVRLAFNKPAFTVQIGMSKPLVSLGTHNSSLAKTCHKRLGDSGEEK